MSDFEWFLLAALTIIHFFSLLYRRYSAFQAVIITFASLPACWLVLNSVTQVLTCDDSYLIYEIVNMPTGNLEYSWRKGAFHTSIALNGPILVALKAVMGFTQDILMVIAKAIHCFWGIALISIISDKSHKWLAPESSRLLFYISAFNATMILPVVNLALHTINYDLLSMCLGVLAVLMLGEGLRSGKVKYYAGSVIIASLAAQEKLIASPVLIICTFMLSVKLTVVRGKLTGNIFSALKAALISVASAVAVFVVSHSIVIAFRKGDIPVDNLAAMIFQPYLSALWPLIRIINGRLNLRNPSSSLEYYLFWILVLVLIVSIAVFSMLYRYIAGKLHNNTPALQTDRLVSSLRFLKAGLLVMITITGIAATFLITPRVYPLIPVPEGFYKPQITFNGVSFSYGAKTIAGHTAASVAWACATFVNAFPSVILLGLLIFWSVSTTRKRNSVNNANRVYVDLLAIASMAAILLFGVFQIPLLPRYINLLLCMFLIAGIIDIASLKSRPAIQKFAVIAGFLLLLIEVLPFSPVPVTFRPLWSNMSEDFNNSPAYGQVPPWCTGWGEEVILAGKKIVREYQNECGAENRIRIFHNYSGSWLRKPENVDLVFIRYGFDDYSYDKCDFYIFSRSGTTFSFIPFPSEIKPLFTIHDRGVIKAWVFRAVDLKAAGIKFLKNYPG
ncbi:MAG: hypothetical protein GX089_12730 [Fibrobacter sp.]|nr:hypothetical protein [Fibrobacter sp.]